MKSLTSLSHYLNRIVTFFGKIGAWFSVLLMLTIVTDVITRSLRQSEMGAAGTALGDVLKSISLVASSTKLQELEWHLHGTLFLMCLGYAYLNNSHVRVTLLSETFSARTKLTIEMLGIALAFSMMCYVMINFGWDFAQRAYLRGEGSSAFTGLPHRWIIKSLLPVSFVLLAMAGLSVFLKCWVALRGNFDTHRDEFEDVFVSSNATEKA